MFSDLKFALRSLAKSPGYTAVAVLTLALGIGASTTIFSVVDTVVLRPFALPHPEQLVDARCVISSVASQYPSLPVNARFYSEWRACPAFADLALFDHWRITLTGSGEPAQLSAVAATANLFATLGTAPALGRSFSAGDDQPGQPPVAVISHRLWRDRFHADPAILGRAIAIDSTPTTIVGVLPAGFRLPEKTWREADIYLPHPFRTDELNNIIGMFNYHVLGRLAPGAMLAAAEAQMNVIAARLSRQANENVEVRGALAPLHEVVVGPVRRGVWILFGAITSVLLLACLNLGILGLARAELRGHDSAVRAALGASRRRLFAHALAESLLLSAAGGALGCLFAWWGLDALVRLAPADLPRLDEVQLDLRVLVFAFGATLLTTVLAGLVPAWHHARSDASSALLARSGRTTTGGRAARRLRQTFVAVEVGVSTLLLTAAALLVGSFARLIRADVGFHAPQVLTTDLVIPGAKYDRSEDKSAYFRRVVAAVSALPHVTAAAVTNLLPLAGETWIDSLFVPGDTRPAFERPQTNTRFVTPDYFAALGIPLLSGRTFRDDDSPQAVVVSAQLARQLWPGQDPIGRKARRGDGESEELEVIGVVGDVRATVDRPPVPFVYRPHWAWGFSQATLAVRTDGSVAPIAAALHRAIRQVDADVPLQPVKTMDDVFNSAVAARRFQLRLIAAFALSALTLAALGIYGVVAHTVQQRTRELGIRLAFGAPPAALRALVLRQGMMPIAIGLGAGLAASLAAGRLLAGFLYETNPRDPLALSAAALGLWLTALLACWLPARRAIKADPMIALRAE